MRACVVGVPTLGAIRRHLGRVPRRAVPPVQLFGCQPDEIDAAFPVILDRMGFGLDPSEARTTHMIAVDGSDREVPEPRMLPEARRNATCDVIKPWRRYTRKLFHDGV